MLYHLLIFNHTIFIFQLLELSVGLQTEGVDVRSVGNSQVH